MKKDLSINQGSIDTAAPEKLKEMMHMALMDSVLQMHAINSSKGGPAQDSKAQSGGDFMKMIHAEKMVTRLQAKFRQKLAIKGLEKDIEVQK